MTKTIFLRCLLLCSLFSLIFSACSQDVATQNPASATPDHSAPTSAPALATFTPIPLPTLTPTPMPPAAWIAPFAPAELRGLVEALNLPSAPWAESATIALDVSTVNRPSSTVWLYALVAPFPTIADGVTFEELKQAWAGNPPEIFGKKPLLMTESTYGTLQSLFGGEAGAGGVRVVPEGLTEALWQERPEWGIVPFGEINPKMKVLEIDGQSPIHKKFDAEKYPLKVTFGLTCAGDCPVTLPASNRDPNKLATVVMTGVTALVRATAYKMELNGVTYPAGGIRDWLTEADIAHISNEIPFAVGCPYPDPNQRRLIFCSDPKYIELLEYVGADVIELTGNHFEDWGKAATQHTVEMYRARNLPYFGGGADLADAMKPALVERNGMKFAFIGCNPAGPVFAWARDDGWPGAAPCGPDWSGRDKDKKENGYEWMVAEIQKLKADGYIVIATFQYFEYYSPEPRPWQVKDFQRMADAGATIVSGSQGHYAQAMEFYNGAFVHYGLGNLFFDQMGYDNPSSGLRTTKTRHEFLDRHVFYDGKLISTELLTAMLEDYSRPRPMTPEERAAFLTEYFEASGWGE